MIPLLLKKEVILVRIEIENFRSYELDDDAHILAIFYMSCLSQGL